MNTSIQTLSFQNFTVSFRADGYLNATEIAQSFGKRVQHYLANERTQEYITALAEAVKTASGNPETQNRATAENQLVIVKKGGNDKSAQGTWLHPKLAIDFARWLNPKFAVWCDMQIEKILHQNSGSPKTTADDRTGLRQAVSALVSKKHIDYSDAYSLVHHRFAVEHIDELTHEQIPQAVEYVHRLILDGEVLDKPKPPALPQLNDELVLSIGRLLLHAQDMRLFVNRYLPAFECLGITNHGALWSYVHDTEPTFERVREFFLQQTPYQNHHLFSDDAIWVRRRVMATIKV
ncbi:KilA-N domain-containing protein [Wielerella bovis]|uniref:KilA-N domain-containing protein n=1 Tax=Wielerella bovis TaxID=2917790 RepID=UPI0020185D7E|nr:KilA-N domain-containing protein [Wielerella bovis]ULJ67471.1 KilA-N domain-containing protein [Wielerella bovis]